MEVIDWREIRDSFVRSFVRTERTSSSRCLSLYRGWRTRSSPTHVRRATLPYESGCQLAMFIFTTNCTQLQLDLSVDRAKLRTILVLYEIFQSRFVLNESIWRTFTYVHKYVRTVSYFEQCLRNCNRWKSFVRYSAYSKKLFLHSPIYLWYICPL